jgi:superfamily II DNA or RNA helicase
MTQEWRWWPKGHETVRILDSLDARLSNTSQIIVPSRCAVERIPSDQLSPIGTRPWASEELRWRAAATRAIAALASPGAAATHNRNLEPLPHQIVALERALATNPIRLLFADEVGLGKTIEAGLVISELLARGRARRILIVAPKGVQLQWVSELSQHFGEDFVLVGQGGIPVDGGIDPWTTFDRVICSFDSIKPLRLRSGWDPTRVSQYNRLRFERVTAARWDLVVIDEAHNVSGSSEDVARYQLAVGLAAVSNHLLLLSATPHSGKSDAFTRLLGLLDERFNSGLTLNQTNVSPLVVRSDKRRTVDARGRPLFQPRTTRLQLVRYGSRHVERHLYDSVTDYVRHGYQRAKLEKRPAVGFLVLLMQRLASSSTAAVLSALERRKLAITVEGTQLALFSESAAEWGELSGEEQLQALQDALGAAWGDELAEVELLIDLARQASDAGMDAKARELLRLLDELAAAESDPALKIVVFTEFTQTQRMLSELFEDAGIETVVINGQMGVHERALAQNTFRERARVLISTDAGGEGVNLQFAHIIINYDLPWSPSRIEQRIGRVDRIGQPHAVTAINLAMEESVDARVLEVLESKLAIILAELGTDKAGDILNSADRNADALYTAAITRQDLMTAASEFESATRAETEMSAKFLDLLEPAASRPSIGGGEDPSVWREIAVEARRLVIGADGGAQVLDVLPEVSPAETVPAMKGRVGGYLSIWEVVSRNGGRNCRAVFLTMEGAMRPDLADQYWKQLIEGTAVTVGESLGEQQWNELWNVGQAYAIRPDQDHDSESSPALVLRLLVRVEP